MKKRPRLHTALLVGILTLLNSSCSDKKESDFVTAREVCGGLSATAASAVVEVTASKKFEQSSTGSMEKLTDRLSSALKEGRKVEETELCRVHPKEGEKPPTPQASFETYKRSEVPPDRKRKLDDEMDFPITLQAISTYTHADIYFECRSTDAENNRESHPVIHGRFSYGPRLAGGEGGLDAISLNMDILQHVARNVAGELGCENNGDIPRRDKPW